MKSSLLLILSAVVGFLSMSQEILWVRLIGFVSGGAPEVFANVLGCFLLGLAGGALLGRRVSLEKPMLGLRFVAWVLFGAAVVYFVSIPVIGLARDLGTEAALLLSYALVAVVAFLNGSVFPLLCHQFIRGQYGAGMGVSWMYLLNVLGCTAGPLLTGFVLLDTTTTEHVILLITIATCVVAAVVAITSTGRLQAPALLLSIAGGAVMTLLFPAVYGSVLPHLQGVRGQFEHVNQTKTGIVTVVADPEGLADIIYGGGMYDGRFSTDPIADANGVQRAYYFAALHPKPTDVLEIGLSSGSWARVIANHQDVQNLTIVEISTGYGEVVSNYPENATILNDPKIDIVIDDGRRWLLRHPERRFDFILMNTTYHWRSQVTNLVSREFLALCKQRLKSGGVVYYNTTGSRDIRYTAAQVFEYVTGFRSFVAASDAPFDMSVDEKMTQLAKFYWQGESVLERTAETREIMQHLASRSTDNQAPKLRSNSSSLTITDDNMATEFKRYRSRRGTRGTLFDKERTWGKTLVAVFKDMNR